MENKKYGYIRVSAKDQNIARQVAAMNTKGISKNNLFIDRQSGKNFKRPAYQKLLKKLKSGDILIVKSIDRLGRNYEEITEQWKLISKKIGCDIVVIDMPLLDTTASKDLLGTFISDIVLQLLSFVAQNERETIRQRQAEGIAEAKRNGVKFGRPEKSLPADFPNLFSQWQKEGLSYREMASKCNMHVSVFYKKIKKYI